MTKILYFLFIIRFRKIVSKDDYLAIFILCFLYVSIAIIAFINYIDFYNYLFIMLVDILIHYINRSDLELLKLKNNYKTILFFEYVIYLSPFLIVFLLKKEYLLFLGFILFKIILINTPKINFKTIPYPFHLFNPFWHISFRKYKLALFFPIVLILIYIAIEHNNENIIYFSFIVLALISCIPSFERERLEEIQITPFDSRKYLIYQIKNSIINTLYIIFPIAIALCFFLKWDLILSLFGILIITLINILLKYVFYSNPYLHQIVFIFFVGLTITLYGVTLLIIPYLYKKSIENLNAIKYANH
ncbi:Putative ABC-type transport system, permease component [Flavobacterium branchiophilum]|uniref:Putative ABC-type transport system, permease component n=1 Tax=Flavobacterium branchiophilum (strain FL-15) TaxID=1034807 RepID=G2Z3V7_FLABF|nr:hypothetical protein [Flavobacterium branchiophilum]CCB68288.1 Putative ABC-type transport system, permease component [Flavobacterium branchiophilum FL-15]